MTPRRVTLCLLVLNGALLLGIALRYTALRDAWSAWSVRRTAQLLLETDPAQGASSPSATKPSR